MAPNVSQYFKFLKFLDQQKHGLGTENCNCLFNWNLINELCLSYMISKETGVKLFFLKRKNELFLV